MHLRCTPAHVLRIQRETAPVQRGIIRHVFLVLDLSNAMIEKDLRPNRMAMTLNYAIEFVTEFFDQNPISQLGILGMRDGIADKISAMSGNPVEHLARLQACKKTDPSGDPSLQNALEMARASLV